MYMYMYMDMDMDMYTIQLVYSIMYIYIYIRYQFNSSQFCHFWCDWSVKCRTVCFFELLRFGDFSVIFHHENQLKKQNIARDQIMYGWEFLAAVHAKSKPPES